MSWSEPLDPAGAARAVDLEAEAERVRTCLAAIANAVHRIAVDAAAFGPYALDRFRESGGQPLDARLGSSLAALLAVQGSLQTWRAGYVSEQLANLGIGPDARGLRLCIGAGRHTLPGWLNIDVHPAQLAIGTEWGIPLPDGSADWVVAPHVLEHLYFPGEAARFARELRRVLAPGGVVRFAVPDIERGLRAYAAGDESFFDGRKATWKRDEGKTKLHAFLTYAGAGPNPGAFLSSHKFGYDFETLDALLRKAGFTAVERSDYMTSRHEILRVDEASQVAGARHGDHQYSLFVEASG